MSLIDELSGLKGENLVSALLAHLLLRSLPIRQAVIELISARSPIGPIIVNKHFAVFTEVVTEERKRIDLLIQTDDAVIGVESKFLAPFQDDRENPQPASYLHLVQKKATDLNQVWAANFQSLLVVLAPEKRENEVKAKIDEQHIEGECTFIAWEDVTAAINGESLRNVGPVERFLADELSIYIEGMIGLVDLPRLVTHLDNPWQPRGSAVIREFFGKVLWSLIEEDSREAHSASTGIQWYGFALTDVETRRPWIGFIDANIVPEIGGNGAALIVAIPDDATLMKMEQHPNIRRVTVQNGAWVGYNCMAIDFASDWIDLDKWEKPMAKVNEVLRQFLTV